MAQLIDLGKIRFYFAGTWQPGAEYELNDVVRYGGNLYVYTAALSSVGHTPAEGAYWSTMMEGSRYLGEFDPAVAYHSGDLVSYGARLYLARGETTGGLPTDAAQDSVWALFHEGVRWRGLYAQGTAYLPGDLIYDGDSTYLVTATFTGAAWPVELARQAPNFTLLARGSATLPALMDQAGKVLSTDGTGLGWVPARRWQPVSVAWVAQPGDLLMVDTSGGSFTIDLPANPAVGASVTIADATSSFGSQGRAPLIRRNGQPIERALDDLSLDISATVEFVYSGTTYGWKVL